MYAHAPYCEVCGLVEGSHGLVKSKGVCVCVCMCLCVCVHECMCVCPCVCVCVCVQVLFTHLRYWFHCGCGRAWWWLLDSFQEAKGLSNNAGYKADIQTGR